MKGSGTFLHVDHNAEELHLVGKIILIVWDLRTLVKEIDISRRYIAPPKVPTKSNALAIDYLL